MSGGKDDPKSAANGGGIVVLVGPAHGDRGPVAEFLDEHLDMVGNRIRELQDEIFCIGEVYTTVKADGEWV